VVSDAVLDLGTGLFAPAEISRVEIRRCTSLSFFGSHISDARVPRCTGEATRFYESTVTRSSLEGEIDADSSKIESVRFGEREPTRIVAWGTRVERSRLCDFVEDTKLEPSALCNVCSDAFAEHATVCKLPQGSTTVSKAQKNFCEVLDAADLCTPTPDRSRPSAHED